MIILKVGWSRSYSVIRLKKPNRPINRVKYPFKKWMFEHRIQSNGFNVLAFFTWCCSIAVSLNEFAQCCAFGFAMRNKATVYYFGFDFSRPGFGKDFGFAGSSWSGILAVRIFARHW